MRRFVVSTIVAAFAATWSGFAASETAFSLNQTGVQMFNEGDLDSAVFYFGEALDLEPESDVIRKNLSRAYQAQASEAVTEEDWDRAIGRLERAVRIEPMSAGPLVHLGSIFLNIKENDNAIYRLEEAIELAPNNAHAHFLLGEAYYRDNDVVAALEQWEWVNKVNPSMDGLTERLERARREASVEEEYEWKQSRRFNITYNPDLHPHDLREIVRILEQAYSEIGRRMRTYPPGPVQVTLYEAGEFSASTQMGAHISGVYDGTRIRCPVLTDDGTLIPREELIQVLYHEYVHVVVRELCPRGVPWWLNEGLSEALSQELDDDRVDVLKYALKMRLFRPLRELTASQLNALDPEALAFAYAQSHATVAYLVERFGALGVKRVLDKIALGEQPERALRDVCRMDYETLELEVEDYVNFY